MTLDQDFAAVLGATPATPARLVGDRVAAAVAQVLSVDGVGLTVVDRSGLTVPIGVSSTAAGLAEQLEFTTGQGPCVDAHREHHPVVATGAALAERWPSFHDLLVTRTRFHSMAALPLPGPLASMLTIGLLSEDDVAAPLPDLTAIGMMVTAALIEADLEVEPGGDEVDDAGDDTDPGGPVWLSGPRSAARYRVMVAAGMLVGHVGLPLRSAIKVLKARAFAQQTTADELAAAVLSGTLPLSTFTLDD